MEDIEGDKILLGRTSVYYVCDTCGTIYKSQSHLKEHSIKVHGQTINLKKKTLKCPLCFELVITYEELDKHLFLSHKFQVEKVKKQFKNLEEFQKWKTAMEQDTGSSYVKMKLRKTDSCNITKFICYRSGFYKPKLGGPTRKRELKRKYSNKIGSHCPSRLKCIEHHTDGVSVDYVPTHVGHDVEIGRLRLTADERSQIAGNLIQGIPSQRILQNISKTFDAKKRISFTTKDDIRNIKNSFNIESDIVLHSEDATSVDILVEKIGNAILSYKPYGVEDSILSTNNFFMVFMNCTQKDMLMKYGNNILMIDSTHGLNQYNIQLTTLMIVDEEYEGFPVAFLWSIAQNEDVFQKFFSCIKKCVPDLKPRIFMSDDANAFYNAFVKVYNYIPNKILCDWHVKKNLNENLSKISVVEKKLEVKKMLKVLINELDVNTFDIMLASAINQLNSDPDTKRYGEYFRKYYADRPSQWAHCHRKGFGKNTNMSLERWHQELKYNSTVSGKCQKRLDRSINNVLECLRLKFMRRLISISRNRVPRKLAELRKRHKHIHMININREPDFDMLLEPGITNLTKPTEEYASICQNLQQENHESDLQKEKNNVLNKLYDLKDHIENCKSADSLTYASTNLTNIISCVTVLEKKFKENPESIGFCQGVPKPEVQVSSNKKIVPQNRLFAAKRRKNKKRRIEYHNDNLLSLNLIMK